MMSKHNPRFKRSIINRLSRIEGHIRHVKVIVEADESCDEILTQLMAVISALNSAKQIIIEEHVSVCINEAINSGDLQEIDNFISVLKKFT